MYRVLLAALWWVLGASSATALARPPLLPAKPSPEEAEVHVQLANELLLEQKYTQAARELEAAYLLEPRPLTLFNIGQIYRKARQPREALENYQRFLDAAPTHKLVVEARAYIADMKVLLAEQERAQSAQQRLQVEQQRVEKTQRELQAEQKRAEQVTQELYTERRSKKPLYKRGWFWAAIGASVTATALAVGLGIGLRPPPRPDTDTGFLDLSF
jgi:tetratricopeptide (TPR) repeat protein